MGKECFTVWFWSVLLLQPDDHKIIILLDPCQSVRTVKAWQFPFPLIKFTLNGIIASLYQLTCWPTNSNCELLGKKEENHDTGFDHNDDNYFAELLKRFNRTLWMFLGLLRYINNTIRWWTDHKWNFGARNSVPDILSSKCEPFVSFPWRTACHVKPRWWLTKAEELLTEKRFEIEMENEPLKCRDPSWQGPYKLAECPSIKSSARPSVKR